MSHADGKKFCEAKGAKLAVACTPAQHKAIMAVLPVRDGETRSAWLNVYRDTYRTSNEMRWNGEVAYDDARCDKDAWKAGEPNDYGAGEGCGEMMLRYRSDDWWGELNDAPCGIKRAVVCQFHDIAF